MSINCIKCVKNRRTGLDLLCDECRVSIRAGTATPFVAHSVALVNRVNELEARLKPDGQVGDRISELEQECAVRKEANGLLRARLTAAEAALAQSQERLAKALTMTPAELLDVADQQHHTEGRIAFGQRLLAKLRERTLGFEPVPASETRPT